MDAIVEQIMKKPLGELPKLSRSDYRRMQKEQQKSNKRFFVTREEMDATVESEVERQLKTKEPALVKRIHECNILIMFYLMATKWGWADKRAKRFQDQWNELLDMVTIPDPDGLPYITYSDMREAILEKCPSVDLDAHEAKSLDKSCESVYFREKYRIGVKALYEFLNTRGHEKAAADVREFWADAWKGEKDE